VEIRLPSLPTVGDDFSQDRDLQSASRRGVECSTRGCHTPDISVGLRLRYRLWRNSIPSAGIPPFPQDPTVTLSVTSASPRRLSRARGVVSRMRTVAAKHLRTAAITPLPYQRATCERNWRCGARACTTQVCSRVGLDRIWLLWRVCLDMPGTETECRTANFSMSSHGKVSGDVRALPCRLRYIWHVICDRLL